MKINIKATAMDLTPAIADYLKEKMAHLDRFIEAHDDDSVFADVEIGKTTKHHKEGDFFKAEINLNFEGKIFRTEISQDNLYAAIDLAKDDIVEQVRSFNKKKNTLLRRGGRTLKNILKKITWRRR